MIHPDIKRFFILVSILAVLMCSCVIRLHAATSTPTRTATAIKTMTPTKTPTALPTIVEPYTEVIVETSTKVKHGDNSLDLPDEFYKATVLTDGYVWNNDKVTIRVLVTDENYATLKNIISNLPKTKIKSVKLINETKYPCHKPPCVNNVIEIVTPTEQRKDPNLKAVKTP